MTRRLKLIVAYDGAPFAGWQSQSHRNTIQDHLEHVFKRIAGRPVRVHGAGRTDAGVHALAQCVHVDVDKLLAPARWTEALNALLPPIEDRRAWHIARPLDLNVLKRAANHFAGTHDFAGFAANRGKTEESTIRTIHSVRVRQKSSCVTIEFDGNGFLYKMVRLMVGSLVKCALGKMKIEDIAARVHSAQAESTRFAAPAEGLFLVRVRY